LAHVFICLAAVSSFSACSDAAPRDSAPVRAGAAQARGSKATPTLDGVRRKGFVQCGVITGVAGFSAPDGRGEWRGLDVDVCRAVAGFLGQILD
jgi:ABC-type amino acid transport substrate-binding protein